MKMKVLVLMLALVAMVGCSRPSIPDHEHPFKYTGPWEQTGDVAVIGSHPYSVSYEDGAHVVRMLNLCLNSENRSIKNGDVVDIKHRLTNDYSTIFSPCHEIESYRIVGFEIDVNTQPDSGYLIHPRDQGK